MAPTLARCPVCGRTIVVKDGRLREHLPPGRFADVKCPGSGGKVAA
jgi:ribosomal protein S27E